MDANEIRRAVALAGVSLPHDVSFSVTGEEPILASPHYLATGAAVARLLTGVGANELWRARGGTSQDLAVNAHHAAAALLSFLYCEVLEPRGATSDPLSRDLSTWTQILPTADERFVQLHGSFHDGPVVAAELGVAPDAALDEIAAAVARRNSFELEAALITRSVCGGVVRSKQEWATHPQGRALVERPIVTITKIGDAPPEPLGPALRPASGLRVLDVTRVLAGPTAAKTFAEHGADVLHVTDPRGSPIAPFDFDTGIGKRQVALDPRLETDAAILRELVRTADVFSQGFRRGTMDRQGLSAAEVAALRPGIVYVSENCYGPVGVWSDRPGWEQLAQAATGMSFREGQASASGIPRLAPAAANDYATGWIAAYGAMMALARRAREGSSWHVQCSLSQTSMWYQALGDDNEGTVERNDVSDFCTTMDTRAYGPVKFLQPALSMSATEPYFALPPSPNGADEPTWLPR